MDTRKAHPHPLCTYIRAVAKQACITYTRKGYAYIGVSQIPRGVMHQFSWRLFGCKPHQNLRYLISVPQCHAKAAIYVVLSSLQHGQQPLCNCKGTKSFWIYKRKERKVWIGARKKP